MIANPKKFQTTNPQEEWFHEGLFVQELVNTPSLPAFSLARCRLPQGATTQNHCLDVAETYIIEQGNGIMHLNKEEFLVKAGDIIPIAKGQSQYIHNNGDEELIFLVHCSPRFTPEAYKALSA